MRVLARIFYNFFLSFSQRILLFHSHESIIVMMFPIAKLLRSWTPSPQPQHRKSQKW